MEEIYKNLAERNGWDFSISDNRPYFMKNGKYAVPDETTSDEDKQLLAHIISEGSEEMAQLILICWDNGVGISGPCSGIREYHDKPPHSLHFAFIADKNLIEPLYNDLNEYFPTFNHFCRENNGKIRYDLNYNLQGKELSVDESNQIYEVIKNQLTNELMQSKQNTNK